VGNAIKFTSKGGVSCASSTRRRRDDGGHRHRPGIARDDHEAIFQEYGKPVTSSGSASARASAWPSRGLVQMHRGFIDLKSQLGKGSTFTIVLPSRPPAVVPLPAGSARQPSIRDFGVLP